MAVVPSVHRGIETEKAIQVQTSDDRIVVIKSRQRVKAYGEVFTPPHMVNQMLDLVSSDLETGPNFVDKTFFEPAAGDGNFLLVILRRKLQAVRKRFESEDWPTESLFVLASIYGVELLDDNHESAQESMLREFVHFHTENGVNCGSRTNLRLAAEFLIGSNILNGNTLTGRDSTGQELEFSWWLRQDAKPGFVQREPFTLASLRASNNDALDFSTFDTYKMCRIDQVHKEVQADV